MRAQAAEGEEGGLVCARCGSLTPAALMAAGTFFVSAVFYASTRRITPVILAHSLHNFYYLANM